MHRLILASLMSILLTGVFSPASVPAAVLTYDANTSEAGVQDGAGAGWNGSNINLWDGAADVAWPNTTGDEAVFGAGSGAAGTVTVGTVTANAVTFNAPGSGNYTLSGGTITLGGTSPTIASNVNATINSILAGTGGLTKTGTGTLTIGGSGAAMDLGTSGVTVTAGTLRLARTSVPFDAGAFTTGTPLNVQSGATLEVAGTWNTGSANVIAVNGGTLNFTNGVAADSSNYANNLNLANATVKGNGIRIGNASHAQFVVTGDAGTTIANSLILVNSGSSARNLTLNVADGAAENDLVLSGILYDFTGRGGNQVVKTGAGTALLSGNNTFTGTVAVNGGRLVMGHQNALGAATNALTLGNVAGAALSLGGYDLMVGSLAGGGATGGEVALGANRLTAGGANASTTYAGVISGTGGLTKTGTGTLTLGGVLSYTGETIVNGGVLVLNKDGGALGDGITGQFASSGHLITVNAGATLRITAAYALGDGKQHQVVVNGGTLDFNTGDNYQNNITLTGAAITTRTTGLPWRTGYHAGNAAITVNASNVSSTISGILCFVRTESGGPGTTTFNVADGTAENDLVVSSTIVDHSNLGGMVLVKDGAGTMVLGGASSFVGGTRIDGGVLRISADNNLGAAPASATAGHLVIAEGATLAATNSLTLSANRGMMVGGTLDVAAGQTLTYNGIAAGTGGLTKTGTGTLALGGASTFTGAMRVDQGVLKLGAGLAIGPGDSAFDKVIINTGGTVDLNGKGGGIYGFTIAGTGADGTGALVNTGSEIGNGIRQTSNIKLSADAMVGGTGSFALLASGSAATTLDLAGFTLTKAGSNTFTVVNTTFTAGDIHVVGGTFAQYYRAHDAGMVAFTLDDTAGVNLDLGGYNLSVGSLAGGGTSGGNVALGANTLTVGGLGTSTSYAGAISGTGGLIKAGAGTLTLGGANTFTGVVAINEGTLALAHGSALGAGTNAVTLANTAGAALSLGGYDLVIGSLAGGGTTGGEIALGANRLTVGGLGTSTSYAGTISGTGGLTKTGTGTLTLGGTLGYAGETIVEGGTLVLNKGGTLAAGNAGQFAAPGNTVTVNSGGTLRMTALWAMGDGGQNHLIAHGGTLDFSGNSNYQNNITIIGGAITGSAWRNGYYAGDALISIEESDVSSTISGQLTFVKNASGGLGKTTFDVADGAADHDLVVSAVILDLGTYQGRSLVKTGPGTMVLSGNNTFIGGAAVDAGTLLVNNTAGSGTGTGAVAVNSGATLGGTGTIGGATTISSGATLATGASVGTLTFGSSLALASGATWDWEFLNNTAGNYDQAVGPTLVLPANGSDKIALNITFLDGYSLQAGDSFTLFTGDVYQGAELKAAGQDLTHLFEIHDDGKWWGTWQVTAGSLVLTAVPEPGTWLLLLSVLACGLLARRR